MVRGTPCFVLAQRHPLYTESQTEIRAEHLAKEVCRV